MSAMALPPARRPCVSCPYVAATPGGVWDPSEYEKLPAYDAPTMEQPPRLFMCHQHNGRVCAGWAGCHGRVRGTDLLALRLAQVTGQMSPADVAATLMYESPVALHGSGTAAALHGLSDVDAPSPEALRLMEKIRRGRQTRKEDPVPEDETLMTKHEVAQLFRVDPGTVQRWVAEGNLRAIRVGRTLRFNRLYIRSLIDDEGGSDDAA